MSALRQYQQLCTRRFFFIPGVWSKVPYSSSSPCTARTDTLWMQRSPGYSSHETRDRARCCSGLKVESTSAWQRTIPASGSLPTPVVCSLDRNISDMDMRRCNDYAACFPRETRSIQQGDGSTIAAAEQSMVCNVQPMEQHRQQAAFVHVIGGESMATSKVTITRR